jgi:hypothetical protein
MSYVIRCHCGNLVAAVVDVPEHRKEAAQFIREYSKEIASGMKLEHLTVEAVRGSDFGCMCPKAPKAPKAQMSMNFAQKAQE